MNAIRRRRAWFGLVSVVSLLFFALACEGRKTIATQKPAVYDLLPQDTVIDLRDLQDSLDKFDKGKVNTHQRKAVKSKQFVEVDVQSIGLTTDIDENNAPAMDRVVARFDNKHPSLTAAMYGIQPKAKADYYMWVRGGNGRTRWIMVELLKQEGGQAKVNHVSRGTFERCDYMGTDTISEAKFMKCDSAHTPAVNKSSLGVVAWLGSIGSNALKRLQLDTSGLPPEDPAWLRCAYGCCTARQTM